MCIYFVNTVGKNAKKIVMLWPANLSMGFRTLVLRTSPYRVKNKPPTKPVVCFLPFFSYYFDRFTVNADSLMIVDRMYF